MVGEINSTSIFLRTFSILIHSIKRNRGSTTTRYVLLGVHLILLATFLDLLPLGRPPYTKNQVIRAYYLIVVNM